MSSWQACDLRPLWRRMKFPNNKKSETGAGAGKKMLKDNEQSQYVYENKQNSDKMPDEKSDICVEATEILQKIASWEGQFAWNGVFKACLMRKFAAEMTPKNPLGRKSCYS